MTIFSGVIDFYDQLALTIKDDAKAMGWSSTFNQQLRFDVFSYMVDFTGASVLDVGCGDGAFFHYLNDHNIDVTYQGIDISSKMVQRAQNRYPGIRVRQANFFDVNEVFDVVVCSGGVSMCAGNPIDYLEAAISHLFSLASSHLVFNCLSNFSDLKSSKLNRFNPSDVLNLCFKETAYVSLNHGYLPHDFTIHMIRE